MLFATSTRTEGCRHGKPTAGDVNDGKGKAEDDNHISDDDDLDMDPFVVEMEQNDVISDLQKLQEVVENPDGHADFVNRCVKYRAKADAAAAGNLSRDV